MSSKFFEKLKKGMDIENVIEENQEEKKEIKNINKEKTEENSPKEDLETEVKAEFQNIEIGSIELENQKKTPEVILASKKYSKRKKIKTNKKSKKISEKEDDSDNKIEIKQESILTKNEIREEAGIFEKQGQLTIDVFETNKHIIIQSAVGGVRLEDLEIVVEKDMICIMGERKRCEEEETERFFFQECYWGKFSREIILPVLVDSSKSEASLENGILTIKIPKTKEQENSKKINIKTL